MSAKLPRQKWRQLDTSPLDVLPRRVYFRAYRIEAGACVRSHQHTWWQFLFAREGLMQVQAGEIAITLPPDYGMWIPPHCTHTLWIGEDVEVESLYITPEAISMQDQTLRVVMVSEFVRAFIHHGCIFVPEEFAESGPDGRKVAVLLDLLQELPAAAFHLPFPTDERFLRICLAIQASPDRPHTLEEVAGQVPMSARSFSRHFLKATGLPFHVWRQRMRLLSSLEMLRSGASVTAVALSIGYATPSAFIHAFRQLFGQPPSRFIASGK